MKRFILFLLTITFCFCIHAQETKKNSTPPLKIEEQTTVESPKNICETNYNYKAQFIKMILVLILLIALVFITLKLFKKLAKSKLLGSNNQRAIKILEKRPLSPKSMLYLIEVQGEKVLISESQLEVRPIQSLSDIEPNLK